MDVGAENIVEHHPFKRIEIVIVYQMNVVQRKTILKI